VHALEYTLYGASCIGLEAPRAAPHGGVIGSGEKGPEPSCSWQPRQTYTNTPVHIETNTPRSSTQSLQTKRSPGILVPRRRAARECCGGAVGAKARLGPTARRTHPGQATCGQGTQACTARLNCIDIPSMSWQPLTAAKARLRSRKKQETISPGWKIDAVTETLTQFPPWCRLDNTNIIYPSSVMLRDAGRPSGHDQGSQVAPPAAHHSATAGSRWQGLSTTAAYLLRRT
jgi:hypothetical protein